jgi:outer membrane protein assembly factor BamB
LVVIAVVVAVVGVTMIRADGDATAESVARPEPRHPRRVQSRVIPAQWSITLPDWPVMALTPSDDEAIVMAEHHAYSVKLRTGALRWKTSMDELDTNGQRFGETAAAVAGDTVLVSRDSGFAALDRATGKVRWRTATAETPSSVAVVGPPGAAQIAVGSTVDGGLVGLDSRTGQARWSVRLAQSPQGTFAVDNDSGTIATIWLGDSATSTLRTIDAATGAVRWEQKVGIMAGSPVIWNGIVTIGSGNGPDDSDVRAFSLADGTPRWSTPVAAPFQPDDVPLVDGGELFVVDQVGGVTRLGLTAGERRWATDTRALSIHAHPIRVDDAILVENGNGEVVTLDRETGEVRARRRPTGLPVGLIATPRFVVVVQRLVRRDAIQAFAKDRLVAAAGSGR